MGTGIKGIKVAWESQVGNQWHKPLTQTAEQPISSYTCYECTQYLKKKKIIVWYNVRLCVRACEHLCAQPLREFEQEESCVEACIYTVMLCHNMATML